MSKLDLETAIHYIMTSECNLPYAAERLTRALGENITEKDLMAIIVENTSAGKTLSEGLRTMLVIKLFDITVNIGMNVLGRVDELKPADAMRAFASLMNSFATMTAPAAKNPFDFNAEIIRAAIELGIDAKEVEQEVKQINARVNAKS